MAMNTLLLYQILVTAALGVLGLLSTWNLLRIRRLLPQTAPEHTSLRVSVLIPARNEERCIEACVQSLCNQDWPNLEVIVLNDGSTDQTSEILAKLASLYQDRLTIIDGKPLPLGWVGKSWACHQLSCAATGNALLFTDADTVHASGVVTSSVAWMEKHNVDAFSLIPFQDLRTPMEHLVVPMVHVLYVAYLPNDLILHSKAVSLSAANGQFMWFRKAAYDLIGGHQSVKNNIVEDVALAKRIKHHGLRLALLDGHELVYCRMYTSAREVVEGFSKNFFPAMNFSVPLMIGFVVHFVAFWTLPLLWLLGGIFVALTYPSHMTRELTMATLQLPLTQLTIAALIRFGIAMRFGMPLWHAFLQPFGAAISAAIGINSLLWALSPSGPRWKGRSYSQSILTDETTNTD